MLTTIYLEGDRCWRRAEGCEGSAWCRWSYESKFVSTSASLSSGSFPFKRNAILYFLLSKQVFCVKDKYTVKKWKMKCSLNFCLVFLKKGFIFGALKRNSCSDLEFYQFWEKPYNCISVSYGGCTIPASWRLGVSLVIH